MKITPRSEEEISKIGLLEEGIYNFEIVSSEEKISKSGNEMIEIEIMVERNDYSKKYIKDYLLNNDNQGMQFKLRHLFDSIGKINIYNSGEINSSVLEGCKGKAIIKIYHDEHSNYPPKNIVKDYIKNNDSVKTINENKFFDDEIAF